MVSTTLPSTWIGTPNYTPLLGGKTVTHITLHIMAGGLTGTDITFANSSTGASATYGIGADGAIHQYVGEENCAWADSSYEANIHSISIEHAGGLDGFANTDECVEASAQLCADIARRYGWESLEHGKNVKLHREMPYTNHPYCPDLCPNPLRWAEIISRANEILTGKTQPHTLRKENSMIIVQTQTPWNTTAYALIGELTGARALTDIEALTYANSIGYTGNINWDQYNLMVTQAWQRHNDFMTALGKTVSESVEEATSRVVNATKES